MAKFIIKRLLITIPIVVLVAAFVFTLLYLTPGDPASMILGSDATSEELAEYRSYLGIDKPYIVQLGTYLYNLFIKMDLGQSWVYKTNISAEIAARMPRTFAICVYSVLIGALLGIPLGVTAAVHQNKLADKIILTISSIFNSVPNYCVALLLVIVFALKLRLFPAYGLNNGLLSYILPCATIMVGSFAGVARQMRSSMLEVIRSDYVVAAKAQGFSKNKVNYFHALPNALIPIITLLGTQFANGLGGTMIIETIFSIPGIGLYTTSAIKMRDRPAVVSCVVFLAILFCLIMLAIDIAYALVDPRIRAQYENANGKKRKRRAKISESFN